MEVHVEQLSPVLVEFRIEVPVEKVNSEVEGAYRNLQRTARVRGFRKGKAPRQVLKNLYSKAIHADVAKRLMNSSLQEALSRKAVQPLSEPAVEPAELSPKKPFAFKVRFEVRPKIDKVEWKGLAAKRASVAVTDEQLSEELEGLRKQHSTLEPVEGRAVKDGDVAFISLSFTHEDHEHSQDTEVELGTAQIMPEIEQGLIGMKVGETNEVPCGFPDDHQDAHFRGSKVNFKITLNELKLRVLPELDDEFAKDCGDYDDLVALKKSLREQIENRHKQRSEEQLARELVADLCAKNPIPVPPSLVQQQSKMSEREFVMMAQMMGQPNDANLRARLRADSEMKVRAGLLMAAIAEEKGIKVEAEDIEKGYEELAEQTGKHIAKIRAEHRDRSRRDILSGMILEDKVLDLLEGAASITEA